MSEDINIAEAKASIAQLQAAVEEAKAANRKREREARQQAEREKVAAWDGELRTTLGHGLNDAQHAIVFSVAYDQGHAYGFSGVEAQYDELAELARKIIAAS